MKTFLHVGCGHKTKLQTTAAFNTDDWAELRLDIDPDVNPDIIGTITDMAAVPDASVDAVFSSHNIEHLYPHEVPQALAEFRRVLRPDGFVLITCPDLQAVAALIAADGLAEPAYMSGYGPITPLDIIFGHRPHLAAGNHFMAHRCGFTEKVLSASLLAAGFCASYTARRQDRFDLWALATNTTHDPTTTQAAVRAHFPDGITQVTVATTLTANPIYAAG